MVKKDKIAGYLKSKKTHGGHTRGCKHPNASLLIIQNSLEQRQRPYSKKQSSKR